MQIHAHCAQKLKALREAFSMNWEVTWFTKTFEYGDHLASSIMHKRYYNANGCRLISISACAFSFSYVNRSLIKPGTNYEIRNKRCHLITWNFERNSFRPRFKLYERHLCQKSMACLHFEQTYSKPQPPMVRWSKYVVKVMYDLLSLYFSEAKNFRSDGRLCLPIVVVNAQL